MTHTREQINQLKNYNVEITFFNRGCMVKVGCKSLAFESIEQAMAELVAYTKDPIGVGKKYAPEEFVELKETCGSEPAPNPSNVGNYWCP
jgi:hypothetical protein